MLDMAFERGLVVALYNDLVSMAVDDRSWFGMVVGSKLVSRLMVADKNFVAWSNV